MSKSSLPCSDDFLLNLKVNNYSDETIYNYERDLTVFEDFLKDVKIDFSKLTKKDILNYKAYLMSTDRKTSEKQAGEIHLSPYSTNRMLSAIRSYLKYLIDMDYSVPVPPDAITMSKVVKNKIQVPDLNEIIQLIEAPSNFEENKKVALRNRAIFEVLFATGLRISELVNLCADKIDKEGRMYWEKVKKKDSPI